MFSIPAYFLLYKYPQRTVVRATGVKAGALQNWLNRKILPSKSRSGTRSGKGHPRFYSLPEILEIAVMYQLSKAGVSVSKVSGLTKAVSTYLEVRAQVFHSNKIFDNDYYLAVCRILADSIKELELVPPDYTAQLISNAEQVLKDLGSQPGAAALIIVVNLEAVVQDVISKMQEFIDFSEVTSNPSSPPWPIRREET